MIVESIILNLKNDFNIKEYTLKDDFKDMLKDIHNINHNLNFNSSMEKNADIITFNDMKNNKYKIIIYNCYINNILKYIIDSNDIDINEKNKILIYIILKKLKKKYNNYFNIMKNKDIKLGIKMEHNNFNKVIININP